MRKMFARRIMWAKQQEELRDSGKEPEVVEEVEKKKKNKKKEQSAKE